MENRILTSIVSYPERGEGGNNQYRGNCSPKLIEDLVGFFKPTENLRLKVDIKKSTSLLHCKLRSYHSMGCYGRFLIQILEKGGEYDVEIAVIITVRQAKFNNKKSWHAALACCRCPVIAVCP